MSERYTTDTRGAKHYAEGDVRPLSQRVGLGPVKERLTYPDEKFVLLQIKAGRNAGMFQISHLVADRDFDPPAYVEREWFGPFTDREAARQYMIARGRS